MDTLAAQAGCLRVADGPQTKPSAGSGEWRASAPRPTVPTTRRASINAQAASGEAASPIEIRGDLCAAARRSYLHAHWLLL